MSKIVLECDSKTSHFMDQMMDYYGIDKPSLISKALAILKIATYIDQTNGKLIARKGDKETVININGRQRRDTGNILQN